MKLLPEKDEETGKWLVGKVQAGGYILVLLVLSGAYTISPSGTDSVTAEATVQRYKDQHERQHDDLVADLNNRRQHINDRLDRLTDTLGGIANGLSDTQEKIDRGTKAHIKATEVLSRVEVELAQFNQGKRQFNWR